MKSVFLITAFALLAVAASAATDSVDVPEAPYYVSLDKARSACDDDDLILIKFYTDWCSWCKRLDTVVLRDAKAIEFFTNEMKLVKINAEEDSATTQHYGVIGYPTAVLIDKDGQEIDRVVGYADTDEYLKTLRDYRDGIGTLDDLLEKAEVEPSREMFYEIADKYKYRNRQKEATAWYQKVIAGGEPKDSLSGESRMAMADLVFRNKDYEQALDQFSSIMVDFDGMSVGELAEIYRAIVFRRQGDTAAAITAFEEFLERHPESEDADYAAKQIQRLKAEPEEQDG
jgi:thioredoxin-related protein